MELSRRFSDGKFSDTEKGIIRYILKNPEQAAGMSIAQLAEQTHSSNTSIIRLCRKAGLEGFRQLRSELIIESENRKNGYREVDYTKPFLPETSIPEIIEVMRDLMRNTADIVCSKLDWKVLDQIARIIHKSRHVFLAATGDSMIRASSFQHKMLKLGKFLIPINTDGDPGSYIAHSEKEDCVLFITYLAKGRDDLRYAKAFSENGTRIIVITSNEKSPLCALADELILFERQEEKREAIGAFYSQMALELILDILYSTVYAVHYQESEKKKRQSEQLNEKVIFPDDSHSK